MDRFDSRSGRLEQRRRVASRAARVELRVTGNGFELFQQAVEDLGEKTATRAYRRALNHTGKRAHTAVVRAAAKQVGLKQSRLKELGRVQFKRAGMGGYSLSARINSTGRYIPLSEFRPRQFTWGVRARPWGKPQRYPGVFMHAGTWNSGKRLPSGGVFFNSREPNPNSGRNNLPIPMWGPAVPTELVKGESARAFEARAADLPKRIEHEIKRVTNGAVS